MNRTFKNAAFAQLAEVGKAFASPARLEILELLAQAPRTVEVLAGEVDQSVANTSHHLQILKRAHLVMSRRAGLHKVYELASADVAELLGGLQAFATHHVAELERLTRDYFLERDALESIDPKTLLSRLRADEAVLIDVRPEHEFAAGHLPGALSVPLATLEEHLESLPTDQTIVAYCRGPFCAFSAEAASRLRELGFDARRAEVSIQGSQFYREAAE